MKTIYHNFSDRELAVECKRLSQTPFRTDAENTALKFANDEKEIRAVVKCGAGRFVAHVLWKAVSSYDDPAIDLLNDYNAALNEFNALADLEIQVEEEKNPNL